MRRLAASLVLASLAACQGDGRPTEFVNIDFVPYLAVEGYETFDVDEDACSEFDDPRVDDALVRREMLAALEDGLTARGFRRATDAPPDFVVHYELWVAPPEEWTGERLRGRVWVRDVESGRFAWRGERKALVQGGRDTDVPAALRAFVDELLDRFPPNVRR